MNIKLKPCPFCGSESVSYRYYYNEDKDGYQVFVKCPDCHTRSGFSFCDENPARSSYTNEASVEIAKRWNNRVNV